MNYEKGQKITSYGRTAKILELIDGGAIVVDRDTGCRETLTDTELRAAWRLHPSEAKWQQKA